MNKIIPLGTCCRLIFDLVDLNIKQESHIFDWTVTNTLTEVNCILLKIIENKLIKAHIKGSDHYIENTNIRTSHYLKQDYDTILLRRTQRFKNFCNLNTKVVFIRDNISNTATQHEIDEFHNNINKLNPNLDYKLLLLSSEAFYNSNVLRNVEHYIYNKQQILSYIENFYNINTFFVKSTKNELD